jgi:hypothetical protein
MTVYIPTLTYKEYMRVWDNNEPRDFGLEAIIKEVHSVDDVDDLDIFEVIDEQKFFLSVIKYGFSYSVILK